MLRVGVLVVHAKEVLKSRYEVLQQGKAPLPDNLNGETLLTRKQAACVP